MQDLCFCGGFTVNPTSAQVHLICTSLVTWVPLCEGDSVVSESCDPRAFSPPGSSAHGISQSRILEWGAIPSSRGSSHASPQFGTRVFQLALLVKNPPANAGCVGLIPGSRGAWWAPVHGVRESDTTEQQALSNPKHLYGMKTGDSEEQWTDRSSEHRGSWRSCAGFDNRGWSINWRNTGRL